MAVLWPSRTIGPLDGVPFDAPSDAILIGMVLPCLWWFDRQSVSRLSSRAIIALLLVWKLASALTLTQQGLCAATAAKVPLHGVNQGIPIEEPSGALRSWDLRADVLREQPRCTAILARPLPAQAAFPAWFLNLTDSMLRERDFTMAVRGFVTTSRRQMLTIESAAGMRLSGQVDGHPVSGAAMSLEPGTHDVDLSLALGDGDWRFEPKLDGRPLWAEALVTTQAPGAIDRLVSSWGWLVAPLLAGALLLSLSTGLVQQLARHPSVAAWTVGSAAAAAALAWSANPVFHRAAGALTLAALLVPVSGSLRGLRGAWLLVGVPWLTFFVVWSLPAIGRFSIYSADDWLTYQVAAHRIYMQGYWMEGGNATFDFQPFYRWMTGALHLVFGDSSVGEVYWDASMLLVGALLAFQIVRSVAGFRLGIAAAAVALTTFTLATPWHFIGRGLSEIAAAGWGFLAMFLLLRARRGRLTWVASAAVSAVLMFYTRLNHLLFGPFLVVMLLPLRAPFTPAALRDASGRVRKPAAWLFLAGFAAGVLLFAWRTWFYTGVFSLFYGTSMNFNDTGLRPWTLLDGAAWGRVVHSFWSLVWMNEPTHPDWRSLVMASGAMALLAALVQLPVARRVPAALVLVTIGATVASFVTHGHAYPGRFSIHVIPLASALSFTAFERARRFLTGRVAA
jgi:hypothetical protein